MKMQKQQKKKEILLMVNLLLSLEKLVQKR